MPYFLVFLLMCFPVLTAKDFGTFGTTYEILEEDLIMVLRERLLRADLDGHWYEDVQNAYLKSIERPKGKTLPKATIYGSREFDPTMTLNEDIKDLDGKIILLKGTKINPLATQSLSNNLIFLDGEDEDQIAWAKTMKGIWILTRGNPLELEEVEKRPVYFDQTGYLTKELGIKSLPAKVTQHKQKLQVEEIPCPISH